MASKNNLQYVNTQPAQRVSKAAITKMIWRSCQLQAAFNYERMQSAGWLWAMLPGLEEIHTLFEQLYTDVCNTVSNGKADMNKEEVTEADVEAMNQKFLDMLDKFDQAVTSVFKDDPTVADNQAVTDAIRDVNGKIEFDEETVMTDLETLVNEVAETDETKELTDKVASQIQLIEEKMNKENKAE